MIKGCTRRVIVVKNVTSDIFEEAHFYLRASSVSEKSHSEADFLSEANRIVSSHDASSAVFPIVSLPKKKTRHSLRDALFFVFGFFSAAACYGLYFLW